MSEGVDWEEILWNLEAYQKNVLAIRDAAINQEDFTEKQFRDLAEMACGFAGSFSIVEIINLLREKTESENARRKSKAPWTDGI